MIEGITIDQLKVFIAAADERSFSAAGRKLSRAQSVISHSVAALEGQLGVVLFERKTRYPSLTDPGRALLATARRILNEVSELKAQARGLVDGLESSLNLVVDVMYPMDRLTAAVSAFRIEFPTVPLSLHVEALGAVAKPVLDGDCSLGIMGSLPDVPEALRKVGVGHVKLIPVVSPSHPLASIEGPVPASVLARHIQLVLSDRTELTSGKDFAVLSPETWRVADLGAKRSFLIAGLGWGNMPYPVVEKDLALGRLVQIDVEDPLPGGGNLPLFLIYRADTPPGPAGRWMIDYLHNHGN